MNWIIGAILGGFVFAGFLIFMIIKLNKKTNIDYVITQTFWNSEKAIFRKGLVDVKNDGTFMAEHVIKFKGKNLNIGTFHQKYLKPSMQGRYIMFLEEYDVNRFRPIVLKHRKEGEKYGNQFVSIPNDDFDYVLRRKEKNWKMLKQKEKRKEWIPIVTSGAVLLIAFVALAFNSYYMHETSKVFEKGMRNFNEGAITEKTVNLIKDVLINETIRDVVKTDPDRLPVEGEPLR